MYRKHDTDRVCQGDILSDFVYPEWVSREDKKIKIKHRIIPYLIILTQDCDLEGDHNNRINDKDTQDKYLQSILVCPAYYAEKLRNGTHLEQLELKMEYQNSKKWKTITNNDNPRYHYLIECKEYQIPELTIDFKHYYSIPRDILYKEIKHHYAGSLNELFRESLSQRFAYYLSRIGLPL
jgi:hypothetical protein